MLFCKRIYMHVKGPGMVPDLNPVMMKDGANGAFGGLSRHAHDVVASGA